MNCTRSMYCNDYWNSSRRDLNVILHEQESRVSWLPPASLSFFSCRLSKRFDSQNKASLSSLRMTSEVVVLVILCSQWVPGSAQLLKDLEIDALSRLEMSEQARVCDESHNRDNDSMWLIL